MRAAAPEGVPYLRSSVEFTWTKGAVKKAIDLKLHRGVAIKGKVIEEGTGRPVGGAVIHFSSSKGDEDVRGRDQQGRWLVPGRRPARRGIPARRGADPRLHPRGDRPRHAHRRGLHGGARIYPHDIIAYRVQAGESPHELIATLRPGKTVKGRVIDPRGQPVAQASILTRLDVEPMNLTWNKGPSLRVHDGRFELHGLDPEKATPVYFLDAEHQWGAAVELPASGTARRSRSDSGRAGRPGPVRRGLTASHVATVRHVVVIVELLVTPGRLSQPFVDKMKDAGSRRDLHGQRRSQTLPGRPASRRAARARHR